MNTSGNSSRSLGQQSSVGTRKCCAFTDCNNAAENLRLCSRCKATYYCGKEHQILHWKKHKKECVPQQQQKNLPESKQISHSPSATATTSASVTSSSSSSSTSDVPSSSSHPKQSTASGAGSAAPVAKTPSSGPQQEKVPPDQESRDAMQHNLSHLNIASTTGTSGTVSSPSSSPEGETENVVEESRTFSHSIIHCNSYPLTPLSDDGEEGSDSTNNRDASDQRDDRSSGGWQAGASEPSIPSGPSRYLPGRVGPSNQSREWLDKLTNYLVECMHRCGLCVIDRVLGVDIGDAILSEVNELHRQDIFKDGQLVKNTAAGKGTIRGDQIVWTDGVNPPCINIQWLISQMDTIVMKTNGHFKNVNIESRTKVRLIAS